MKNNGCEKNTEKMQKLYKKNRKTEENEKTKNKNFFKKSD